MKNGPSSARVYALDLQPTESEDHCSYSYMYTLQILSGTSMQIQVRLPFLNDK